LARTTTIRIGGQDITIHAFNIGELERVSQLFEGRNTMSMAFGILRIAMERAEPKVLDVNALEIESMDEIVKASSAILALAGLNKPNGSAGDPQTGPAAGS
jgi:hypothetical protein